jgi:hypothetical protein
VRFLSRTSAGGCEGSLFLPSTSTCDGPRRRLTSAPHVGASDRGAKAIAEPSPWAGGRPSDRNGYQTALTALSNCTRLPPGSGSCRDQQKSPRDGLNGTEEEIVEQPCYAISTTARTRLPGSASFASRAARSRSARASDCNVATQRAPEEHSRSTPPVAGSGDEP